MAKKKSGPDLAARFAKLSEDVKTEAEKALFEIGIKVRDAARRLAPVKTDKLRSSYAVRMRYRGQNPAAVIGSLVPYAVYVEFAKDINGHAYGKNLREPARVLYRSLDENEDAIVQMISDAVGRGLGGVGGA